MSKLRWRICVIFSACFVASASPGADLRPVVEVEEDVYTYNSANNGAGPMWCSGSTCLARVGQKVFATGLETLPDAKPLNNCRWMLYERLRDGWKRIYRDVDGRTREPAPLAFGGGSIFVSANPTLGHGDEPNGGPARPEVFEFAVENPSAKPTPLLPVWRGTPPFREHSYRSFAADGRAGEIILFQNIDYTHAEWAFRGRHGKWSTQGQLPWPWGAEYDQPGPVRVCYPDVALKNHAVYFCGVSDIVEPYRPWREFKEQLTGQHWDYDFRRLFFTWTPDITRKPFGKWVEISSCDKTCGWISPGDLFVDNRNDVHLVWSERAIDERLRAKFFPEAKQRHSLNYAIVHEGQVIVRKTIEESTEDKPGIIASAARFQSTPEHRLFVSYYTSGTDANGKVVHENRIREVLRDGAFTPPVRLPLSKPFTQYFTATVRGGSPTSRLLDMLGIKEGAPLTISYARVRLY